MKNKLNLIWLIAVIGLVVMACDSGTGGGTTPNPCANGHNFGDDSDWVKDAEAATCTHPSHDTRNCKNAPCTEKDRRTGSHPSLGHDLPGAYPATCMAAGYTGTGHCDRCGEDETGKPIPLEPGNHDFSGTPVITPATCTGDGEEVVNCGNYGCTKKHETVLEALGGHTYPTTTAATCTADSIPHSCNRMIGGTPCENVNPEKIVPAFGHKWNSVSGAIECDRDRGDCTFALAEYIQAAQQAGTAADPVPLKVSIELTGMGTGAASGTAFTQLLTALATGGKLVALDLSGSYRSSDGAFTTGSRNPNITGAPGLEGLRQIVSIVLPEITVTSITSYAFINCTNLTSITIPASVTSISSMVFTGCTSLISFTVDAANQNFVSVNGILYNKDMTTLISFPSASGNVTIPDGVTRIGGNAFSRTLTSVIIPASVTTIEMMAFVDCTNLTSVTFERADTAFSFLTFPQEDSLMTAYTAGGIGTYILVSGNWTKQE